MSVWDYPVPGPGLPGFRCQFCSDIDGVRFVIVDEREFDMTGWRIEVFGGPWSLTDFDKELGWFREGGGGPFSIADFDRELGWFAWDGGGWNPFSW